MLRRWYFSVRQYGRTGSPWPIRSAMVESPAAKGEYLVLTLLYNSGQALVLLAFSPILLALALAIGKYRRRLPARLGFALGAKLPPRPATARTFWLHALSVGEVTSALPLVLGIRRQFPADRLIVTVATESGEATARRLLADHVDQILAAPLDILPVLQRFIRHIQPDVYILVETDFWPNILACLGQRRIPMVLVNGRISPKSLAAYRRFAFFFPADVSFLLPIVDANRSRPGEYDRPWGQRRPCPYPWQSQI